MTLYYWAMHTTYNYVKHRDPVFHKLHQRTRNRSIQQSIIIIKILHFRYSEQNLLVFKKGLSRCGCHFFFWLNQSEVGIVDPGQESLSAISRLTQFPSSLHFFSTSYHVTRLTNEIQFCRTMRPTFQKHLGLSDVKYVIFIFLCYIIQQHKNVSFGKH